MIASAPPVCETCRYHAILKKDGASKLVCVYDPPKVFATFVTRPGITPDTPQVGVMYDTLYPNPPAPCAKYEWEGGLRFAEYP